MIDDEEYLKHIYISPLEVCNLCCKMCYTAKTKGILTNESILEFIRRYDQITSLQSITFCGGEVFLIDSFPELINQLTSKYYVQIITNGTIDKLSQIKNSNMLNLIVSIDGLPSYHDSNRGENNFHRSIAFLKKAQDMGFHTEIFSIVTEENYPQIEQFEKTITDLLPNIVEFTYHPRKPLTYLNKHPISNRLGQQKNFTSLTAENRLVLGENRRIFPPLDLSCYQLSLMSDGKVYGCCEGIRPLGEMSDDINALQNEMRTRIAFDSRCVEPDFRCGL